MFLLFAAAALALLLFIGANDASATDIGAFDQHTKTLTTGDDVDQYYFTQLPVEGNFYVFLSTEATDAELHMYRRVNAEWSWCAGDMSVESGWLEMNCSFDETALDNIDPTYGYNVRILVRHSAVGHRYTLYTRHDAFEDNDERDDAAPIQYGRTNHLDARDPDWYRIGSKGYDPIWLNVTLTAYENLTVTVRYENETVLANGQTAGVGTSVRLSWVPTHYTQTYYILVESVASQSRYDLEIVTAYPYDDQFEDNDALATPAPLSWDETLNTIGSFYFHRPTLYLGDEDHYSLDFENRSGYATISIVFNHSLGDLELEIMTPSGEVLDSSSTRTDLEGIWVWVENRTELIIRVHTRTPLHAGTTPHYWRKNSYDLTVTYIMDRQMVATHDDRYEDNDDFAAAMELDEGSHENLIVRYRSQSDPDGRDPDPDHYRVWMHAGDRIVIFLQYPLVPEDHDDQLNLSFHNSSYSPLVFSSGTNPNEQITAIAPYTGYYYIRIASIFDRFYTTDYRLELTIDDYLEENDERADAKPLTCGRYKYLYAKDPDWYEITVPADRTLDIICTFTHDIGDIDMVLWTADDTLVDYSVGITDEEYITRYEPSSVTYYLEVYYYDYINRYNLTIGFDDRYEHDDWTTSAMNLSTEWLIENGSLSGLIGFDDDLFAVHCYAGDALTANISFAHADGDLDLVILAPDETFLDSAFSTTDNEELTLHPAPSTGWYYVWVYPYGAPSCTPYTLTVTVEDRFEENDDLASAAPLAPSNYTAPALWLHDQHDYYALDLNAGDDLTVSISFTHAYADLDLLLLDANGTILENAESSTDDETVSRIVDTGGTYYLHVWTDDDTKNGYDLSVDRIVNYAPAFPSFGVEPAVGNSSTSFTFYSTYRDANGDAPDAGVELVLDGVVQTMTASDPGDTNYLDGKDFTYTTTLSAGDHIHRFRASDGYRSNATASVNAPFVNTAPTLTDWTVDPASGNTSTSFTFTVQYTDIDDDAPVAIAVLIDGDPYDLVPVNAQDEDYHDGRGYHYTTALGAGNHSYRFCAWYHEGETRDLSVRTPLQYILVNTVPELISLGVAPGSGNSTTEFTFSVRYLDADNDAPTAVTLEIGGATYPMSPVNDTDTNYLDGRLYTVALDGLAPGNHSYRSIASDGADEVATPFFDGPSVEALPDLPYLSDAMVDPSEGTIQTTFHFSVLYTHPGGVAPDRIVVLVDGAEHALSSEGGGDITLGQQFGFSTRLERGEHQYRFEAVAGGVRAAGSDAVYDGPTVNNIAPVLEERALTPQSGSATDEYTYAVRYRDAEGDAPAAVAVVIDGEPHEMAADGTTQYTTGVVYSYTHSGLEPGTHAYYFTADDAHGGRGRFPATGTFSGPAINAPPELFEYGVTPAQGDTTTTFTYFIRVSDADDGAAPDLSVIIDGDAHTMTAASRRGDGRRRQLGGTDAVEYRYSTVLGAGNHSYRFRAVDGPDTIEIGPFFGPNVTLGDGPQILSRYPEHNAQDIPRTVTVRVRFDRALDEAASTITVECADGEPVAGGWSFITENQTATWTPSAPLDVETQYWINANVSDLEGRRAPLYRWRFTTVAGDDTVVQLVDWHPREGAVVAPSVPIWLQYDRAVDMDHAEIVLVDGSENTVALDAAFNTDTLTVELSPVDALAWSTEYTLEARVSALGERFGDRFILNFTIEPSLAIIDRTPTPGQRDVARNTTVTVWFNKPLVRETLDYRLEDADGTLVVCSVFYNDVARRLELRPNTELDTDTVYSINISVGGHSGSTLSAERWSFTTADDGGGGGTGDTAASLLGSWLWLIIIVIIVLVILLLILFLARRRPKEPVCYGDYEKGADSCENCVFREECKLLTPETDRQERFPPRFGGID